MLVRIQVTLRRTTCRTSVRPSPDLAEFGHARPRFGRTQPIGWCEALREYPTLWFVGSASVFADNPVVLQSSCRALVRVAKD